MRASAALNSATTEYERTAGNVPWWQSKQPFAAHELAQRRLQAQETACFRIGDRVLEVSAGEPSILDSVRAHYGDCEQVSLDRANLPFIRCVVNAGSPSSLIAIHFLHKQPLDLAKIALGLSHPPNNSPPYAISDAQWAGWSLIGGADRTVVATCRTGLLVDPTGVAEDFVADYLIAATLRAQPDLMVLHAAALQTGSGGAILTGASHAGKTTTAMHLASRGHRLLGDEMAVIRLGSRELLPLRRSLSLRAGPRSRALVSALQRARPGEEHFLRGDIGSLRISELFFESGDEPVELKAAFFLNGFSEHPAIEPFYITMNDENAFDHMSANDVASISWGFEPRRRALRLLALKQLMGHLQCWNLIVGSPDETARLIESTMEEG